LYLRSKAGREDAQEGIEVAAFWNNANWRDHAWLDRLAMIVSGLCVVHCLATAVFVLVLSSVGEALLDPIFHEIGLVVAIGLATISIGRGIFRHGYMLPAAVGGLGLGIMAGALSLPHGSSEMMYTILGVAIVALGHDLNRRALI